ncbi:cation:proton antiporter [Streptomyces sp. NPDC046924]|uniref:cation:proton antiporter n=1 Tax=Streptomyces sp. NPDC046924 TaxID=3155136 RepID=UPI0033F90330
MNLSLGFHSPAGNDAVLLLLLQMSVLLATAVLLGRLAARFGLPAVVGELSAGVVLGPSLLGNAVPAATAWLMPETGQVRLLDAVTHLGLLLLVAVAGAHIDLESLRSRGRAVSWVSAGSVLLPLVCGVALGWVLPGTFMGGSADRVTFALFMGVALAVSALPVIAKTLLDMNLLHRDVGQLIVGAAAVSDIVGWLLLSVVSATATSGFRTGTLLTSGGALVLALAAALLLRPVSRRLLPDQDGPAGGPGSRVAVTVLLVLLCSAGSQALGLEAILGAFLCGIVIGSLGIGARRAVEAVRPLVMAVLAPLFLASAGLKVDLSVLKDPVVLGMGLVALAVAIGSKYLGSHLGARLGRLSRPEAQAIGVGLNARGVVEIVLASVGLQLGVLSVASYTVIVLIAVVTSVMAPPVLRRATSGMAITPAETERGRRFAPDAPGARVGSTP